MDTVSFFFNLVCVWFLYFASLDSFYGDHFYVGGKWHKWFIVKGKMLLHRRSFYFAIKNVWGAMRSVFLPHLLMLLLLFANHIVIKNYYSNWPQKMVNLKDKSSLFFLALLLFFSLLLLKNAWGCKKKLGLFIYYCFFPFCWIRIKYIKRQHIT